MSSIIGTQKKRLKSIWREDHNLQGQKSRDLCKDTQIGLQLEFPTPSQFPGL
jgi:hypothetical protein